jgi:hypothetical protein
MNFLWTPEQENQSADVYSKTMNQKQKQKFVGS